VVRGPATSLDWRGLSLPARSARSGPGRGVARASGLTDSVGKKSLPRKRHDGRLMGDTNQRRTCCAPLSRPAPWRHLSPAHTKEQGLFCGIEPQTIWHRPPSACPHHDRPLNGFVTVSIDRPPLQPGTDPPISAAFGGRIGDISCGRIFAWRAIAARASTLSIITSSIDPT